MQINSSFIFKHKVTDNFDVKVFLIKFQVSHHLNRKAHRWNHYTTHLHLGCLYISAAQASTAGITLY